MDEWKALAARLKFDEGKSWTETAKALRPFFPDLSDQQIWEKVRGALRQTDTYKTKGKVTFEDKKEPTAEDVDTYYEQLKSMNSAVMRLETKQTKATIHIDEDKPIELQFIRDAIREKIEREKPADNYDRKECPTHRIYTADISKICR